MAEAKVLKTIPMPSSDPATKGGVNTWVIYQVDGKRTETVVLPKESPTEAEIQTAVKAAEAKRAKITGSPFKV